MADFDIKIKGLCKKQVAFTGSPPQAALEGTCDPLPKFIVYQINHGKPVLLKLDNSTHPPKWWAEKGLTQIDCPNKDIYRLTITAFGAGPKRQVKHCVFQRRT